VGILDVIPKPVVLRLLDPVLRLSPPVRLICHEDKADRLLADLAARRTDIVLSDSPISTEVEGQGFNHPLGECGVSFFAVSALAARYRKGFPRSLDGAPLLLPSNHTAIRRALNLWFERRRIHPAVVAEFDDSATMRVFGQSGQGIFPVPSLIDEHLQRDRDLKLVGRTQDVRARFYAISLQARPTHPAVLAICQAAR
jgi:LysR family transcriptional activator of nhaA